MSLPLTNCHRDLGAAMTDYAGYSMPLHYGDILREHKAVRTACGLFDCSHMGEFLLTGTGAATFLDRLLTNRFDNLPEGRARYAVMCNERGGAVDDVIVYRLREGRYLVVVNAGNRQKDFAWFSKHLPPQDVVLTDVSEQYALLALQGPLVPSFMETIGAVNLPAKYFHIREDAAMGDIPLLAAQTGYTGEEGYEFYCAPEQAVPLWNLLLDKGKDFGITPCGLGARDTLRLEASLPLYGHELSEDITPLEAGLGFAVKLGKADFIGKSALLTPPKRRLTGLRATGRGILREGCEVFWDTQPIGVCTSGTFCPTLGGAAALALLEGDPPLGTELTVRVRRNEVAAKVVELPLYSRG